MGAFLFLLEICFWFFMTALSFYFIFSVFHFTISFFDAFKVSVSFFWLVFVFSKFFVNNIIDVLRQRR